MKIIKKSLKISLVLSIILTLISCSVKKEMVYETEAAMGSFGFKNTALKQVSSAASYSYDGSYEEASPDTYTNSKKLIKIVDISSETKEFDRTIEWLKSYVESYSGIIDNSYIDSGNTINKNYRKSAYFSVRVPAENLEIFLSKIGDNLNITFKQESINDVTDSYDDTEKRKNTLLIEEEKLNELLKKANAVEDIVTIESKLSEVRYEIQNIENRLKRYDKQIDYSTVNINIAEVIDLTEKIETEDYSKNNLIRLLNKNFEDTKRFAIRCGVFVFTHIPAICLALIAIVIVLVLLSIIISIFKRNNKNKDNTVSKSESNDVNGNNNNAAG